MSFWNFIGGLLLFKWLFGKKQNRLDESTSLNNNRTHSRYSDDDLDARLDGIEDFNDLHDLNDFRDLDDFGNRHDLHDLNDFRDLDDFGNRHDLDDLDNFRDLDDFGNRHNHDDFGNLNGFGLRNERADSDDLFGYGQYDSDPDDFRDPFDDDDF